MDRAKITVVTNGNFFANLVLAPLLSVEDHDYQVFVTLGLRKASGNRLVESCRLFRRWGLRYSLYKIVVNVLPGILASVGARDTTVAASCRKFGIPVQKVRNINSPQAIRQIAAFAPDILLSVSCPYRIRPDLLHVPRIGALNVHASRLPEDAGLAPYVHVLADDRRLSGVTIHEMVQDFDAGLIVHQIEYPVKAGISSFSLFADLCVLAGRELPDVVGKCVERQRIEGVPQDVSLRSYQRDPTASEIIRLRRNGFCLVRAADLRRLTKGPAG